MDPADLHWWLNLASAAGIAVLSVPVWSLNARKKKLQAVQDALPQDPQSFRDNVKGILGEKWQRDVAAWRRLDELCLAAGYLLLLGSAVARLFVPLA
ncbi:hypothetical protein FIU97_11475 [Roseivivax sp. THAF40]|uniref:hypothetical protein n=1 Tax=unclassified Roseivivax TaxID=2639302 RepID=UPI001268D041|nr:MULTISPECIES: hypothetical protein [unclassified Roseivivax]QFS83450.1 hypothetical protein FIV09_11485 [Roseivivax sp. THAF197b]QFT47195.1 hypothetical protein FIU97_11475 [Roseivivax sp. THAF40]